jgi:hypothetical protein
MGSRNVFTALLSIFISSTLTFSLCAAGSNRREGDGKYEIVNDFISEGWEFKIGGSLSDMRKVGKVTREVTSIEDNKYDEKQKDEVRELYFDGLYIQALFLAKNHRKGLIEAVEVTKPNWKIKHGLNVGVSISKVKSILGDPDEVKDNVYIYKLEPLLGMAGVGGVLPNLGLSKYPHLSHRIKVHSDSH